MSHSNTQSRGDKARYLEVRLAFLSRGTSLHAWCVANGVAMQNARAALLGLWRGPKASALITRITDAAKDGCDDRASQP